jgi:hypothetical protein
LGGLFIHNVIAMDPPPAKRQRTTRPDIWRCMLFLARLKVRAKRERPQLDILFGNGKGDIGVIEERVRCKDIRNEIKAMTEVLRDPADPYRVLCRGITVAERISCLGRFPYWKKDVVAVRTRTGVAVLNDAYGGGMHIYSCVQGTYQRLRKAGLDVEYIPPQHYKRYSTDFDMERHGSYFMWSPCHGKHFNRGTIAGIRLLNEEGRKQRQMKRTRAFAAELMAHCWRPDGPLMQAYGTCAPHTL